MKIILLIVASGNIATICWLMARRAENFLLYISNAIAATACIIMALS